MKTASVFDRSLKSGWGPALLSLSPCFLVKGMSDMFGSLLCGGARLRNRVMFLAAAMFCVLTSPAWAQSQRGFVGITVANVPPGALQQGISGGAWVQSLVKGGPAEQAGIKPNDIVVAVNGATIAGAQEMTRATAALTPGQPVQMDVLRWNGHSFDKYSITLTAGAFPAQSAQLANAPAVTSVTKESPQPAHDGMRFAVAHQHTADWCLGYLSVDSDSISYDVVGPEKDKKDSFKIKRSEVRQLGRWTLLGQQYKAVELKFGKSTYHFWWLPNEQDVLTGRPYTRFGPLDANDPDQLIAAITDPSRARGGNTATAQSPASPTSSLTSSDGAHSSTATQPTVPLGAQAPLPAGAMEGVYIGYFLSGGFKPDRSYLIFDPGGWVVKGMPEAMEGFDFTAYRNSPTTNKSWAGRYRLGGNEINIIWQDYPDDRQIITRNEGGTSPGLGTYVPTCRCTGKRFSGVYLWGPPTSQQYLQFLLDGTFVDNRLMDTITVSGPYFDHPRLARGTYSIKDRTLTLNYSDGRILKQILLAPKAQENEQVFDWIEVNQHAMFERQHQPSP